jgi:hypothetical protein
MLVAAMVAAPLFLLQRLAEFDYLAEGTGGIGWQDGIRARFFAQVAESLRNRCGRCEVVTQRSAGCEPLTANRG